MGIATLRLSTRLKLLIVLILIGFLGLSLVSLANLRANLIEDRQDKTRNLVEVGLGLLEHYEALSRGGQLSPEEAQAEAREALRGLRYAGTDYFFIFDTHHTYVLLPTKPEFEGQDKSEMRDAKGKYLIRELVKAALAGGGFVDYYFPRAGQNEPEPKLSYVALFEPWDWVIGTGIYVTDVDEVFAREAWKLGGVSVAVTLALALVAWWIGAGIERQLGGEPAKVAHLLSQVAEGDLRVDLGQPTPGSLLASAAEMVARLRQLFGELGENAERLLDSAERVQEAATQISGAAVRQSEATTSVVSAVEQLAATSRQIAGNASETEEDAQSAMALAGTGNQRVENATQAIGEVAQTMASAAEGIRALEARATQISSIANVIKDIAAQTNLLALNAAIEAARAGEQGRGFAVVADEVRQLAERTTRATAEIEEMIGSVQQETGATVALMQDIGPRMEQGVQRVGGASEALRDIEAGARRTLSRASEVAQAMNEQSSASTLIAERLEQIALMIEETKATTRSSTETAAELDRIAQGLREGIGRFRL